MSNALVVFNPGHYPSLEDQHKKAIETARSFHKNEGRDTRTSAWIGLWYNSKHNVWLVGCCHTVTDRGSALIWYDNMHREPARIFFVKCGIAYLRCAKDVWEGPE